MGKNEDITKGQLLSAAIDYVRSSQGFDGMTDEEKAQRIFELTKRLIEEMKKSGYLGW